MSYFWEEVMLPIIFIGWLLFAFVGAIFAVVLTADYLDCQGFNKGTGIETRWQWGCYAKVEGQWVPKEYAFGKVNELRIKEKK